MAMPAITAKAANKLPLTPQRGFRNPKTLPRPNPTFMRLPRDYPRKKCREQYRGRALTKLGILRLFGAIRVRQNDKAGVLPALSLTSGCFRAGSVPRGDGAGPVDAVVHASPEHMVVGGEAAGRDQCGRRGEIGAA